MGFREANQRLPLLIPATEGNDDDGQIESDGVNLIRRTWWESKKLWHIAGPSIFTRLAMFSLTVVTQSFAGHLSDEYLSAISIVTTVIIGITYGVLLGMASALETLCGQAYGAKQYHMLGIYLQRSWVVLFVGSILLLPLFLFATPILKLTGQSPAAAELSGVVALWLIPMHLSFAFQFTLVRFLQCQLKTAVIAWVSAGTLALHVFVSWLFVYKLRVGIVATAVTLDFSWWVSVLGLFGYVFWDGGCSDSWTGFSNQAFVGIWEFFKLSVASGVMVLLENFYYRVLIIVSGTLKNAEVALTALSICISIFAWESMIPLGFFAATGVRVANELGAGNAEGAKFASIVSVFTSVLVGIFFWILIIAFPDKVAMIFTSNTSVITMVNELAILLAFTIFLNCIQPVLSGVAVGSGWQALVAYINIGSYYIVGVPLGIILGWFFNFGIKGSNPMPFFLWMEGRLHLILNPAMWELCAPECPLFESLKLHYKSYGAPIFRIVYPSYRIFIQFLSLISHAQINILQGIWGGMISGTVVQTLILTLITTRCKWEKEVQKARIHVISQAASN